MKTNIAIYIHWPFCKSKCPYCDFNSHVSQAIDQDLWLKAYLSEIEKFREKLSSYYISSIFFGGGTPSLMPPKITAAIIERLSDICQLAEDVEITLEANPTSVEAQKFREFKEAGVNRVSLGIQSLNDKDLKFLGREHSSFEAMEAISLAAANFDNYSFDLIYSRPGQTIEAWQKELEKAVSLAAHHISLYQLTIEKGTKFFAMEKQKKFIMPEEELSLDLFLATDDILSQHGFDHYEISNFAKPGKESRHNLSYWRYDEYLGIGPGAHSRLQGLAFCQYYKPEKWLEMASSNTKANFQEEQLSKEEIYNEILMMGLRIKEGVQYSRLKQYQVEHLLPIDKLRLFEDQGWLKNTKDNISLTNEGMIKINAILQLL